MTLAPDEWAVAARSLPLAFAQVREDPRLDVELARSLPEGGTVVMIASGGETVACLRRLPLRLHLVDMNPAQIALSRVKWALAERGGHADAAALLGHAPLPADERWRRLGELSVALGFPEDMFGPKQLVAALGPDFSGRYEVAFAELRKQLAPLQADLDAALNSGVPVMIPGDSPLGDAMDAAFAGVMRLENLVCLFGEDATQNPRLPFSEHFASRTRAAFGRMAPAVNPFLWQILAGRFHPATPYDWLQGDAKGKADAEWYCGEMDDVLDTFPEDSADLVHLSNILDWLSPVSAQALLGKVARVLKPGGRVIVRQLNSTLSIPTLECGLNWDIGRGREFESRDRSYFYPKIHIGESP